MKSYVSKSWIDWILCFIVSGTTSLTVCSGFELEGSLAESPAAAFALCMLLTLIYFVFAYRRVLQIVGIAAGVIVCAAAVFVGREANVLENESANSLFIFVMICFLSSLVVFLLSRTRAGSVVMLVLGSEVIAFAAFLEYSTSPWTIITFAVCGLMLLFYRIYMAAQLSARLGDVNIAGYMLQTLIFTLGAAVIAGGMYFAVVKTVNPPTFRLKLLTVLERLEVMQVLGISDLSIITDPDLKTDISPERTEYSGTNEEETDEESGENKADNETESTGASETQESVQTESSGESAYSAIRYNLTVTYIILIVCAAVLLIASAYLIRLLIRFNWHRRVKELSPSGAAVNYYNYFLVRLKRAGIKRNTHQSLKDFSKVNDAKLQAFETENITFAKLTAAYEQIIYNGGAISRDELQNFEKVYAVFHRNLRKHIGSLKYYLTAFRF